VKKKKLFSKKEPMLEQLLSNRSRHALCELRERANVSQKEISKATGLSCSKISLCENGLGEFSESEQKKIRSAIVEITRARQRAVLSEARR
jgi:predicted transcriptional regulator